MNAHCGVVIIIAAQLLLSSCAAEPSVPQMISPDAERLGVPIIPKALNCDVDITKQASPGYPRSAIRKGVEGWVILEYSLDGTGRAHDIVVVNSTPKNLFEQAAITALKQVEFKSNVVRSKCQASFTYTLH